MDQTHVILIAVVAVAVVVGLLLKRRKPLDLSGIESDDAPIRGGLEISGQNGSAYRLGKKLGTGAMGTVYEATSVSNKAVVAVKTFTGAHEAAFNIRFHQEIASIVGLSHPNIVRVSDEGHSPVGTFLVMDLIKGRSLDRIGSVSPDEFRRIFGRLVDAVAYAHEQGVLHRDIKPKNVLMKEDGQPVILDFGIAAPTGIPRNTKTGAILGTPLYTSPEQIQGKQATPLSDQYSLGLIGYQMLTGALPFDAQSTVILIGQKLAATPKPLQEVAPQVPADLAATITRMLAKEPQNRFPSLREISL